MESENVNEDLFGLEYEDFGEKICNDRIFYDTLAFLV